jgi:fructose-1,6-bisphosphatase/inositol monophosphatase family enzyme
MNEELKFAQTIADHAGKIMLENFGLNTAREWKADTTPITVADTAINDMVIEEVKKHFPEHGVLGEEASYRVDSKMLWVVDPIDGTMPYINGLPMSVFSLALVDDGRPVVGVVQDPFCKRQYYAKEGGGAFVNGHALQVNNQDTFGPQVFIEADAKTNFAGYNLLKFITILAEKGSRVSKNFSAVYNSLPVLTGKYAAAAVFLEYPWDGAAVSLLVKEAGGTVTDLHGQERKWNELGDGFVVSNGKIHQAMLEAIKDSSD